MPVPPIRLAPRARSERGIGLPTDTNEETTAVARLPSPLREPLYNRPSPIPEARSKAHRLPPYSPALPDVSPATPYRQVECFPIATPRARARSPTAQALAPNAAMCASAERHPPPGRHSRERPRGHPPPHAAPLSHTTRQVVPTVWPQPPPQGERCLVSSPCAPCLDSGRNSSPPTRLARQETTRRFPSARSTKGSAPSPPAPLRCAAPPFVHPFR